MSGHTQHRCARSSRNLQPHLTEAQRRGVLLVEERAGRQLAVGGQHAPVRAVAALRRVVNGRRPHRRLRRRSRSALPSEMCWRLERKETNLNNSGVLRKTVVDLQRLTNRDVLDVTSSEDDVLEDLVPRRHRSVRGSALRSERPH